MKKWIIGAIVGGILTFAWQTVSWTAMDLHRAANAYTPKQDTILNFLNSQFSEDGQFFMPMLPPGTSAEQYNAYMKNVEGKPWAKVAYHKSWKTDMTGNIIRGLLVNIFMVALLIWILMKIPNPSFTTIFLSSLFTGLIAFTNFPYTTYIWYESADIRADLADAVIMWSLCGLWLGWWLRRK